MTSPRKGLFSVMLYKQQIIRVKNPNWQEGWPEGYLHQRDRPAEDLNLGPSGCETTL